MNIGDWVQRKKWEETARKVWYGLFILLLIVAGFMFIGVTIWMVAVYNGC